MAYSGPKTNEATGWGLRQLWTDFIRFVTDESSTPGRDWQIIINNSVAPPGSVAGYSQSGTLTVVNMDQWHDLPTANAFDFSCNKGGTPLTEGTDYELDVARGWFKPLSGGSLAVDDVINFDYTFKSSYTVIFNDGLSGDEKVYLGFVPIVKSDGVTAGLVCKAYRHFDDSMSWFDTAFGSPYGQDNRLAFIPFGNDMLKYWIFSNQQRIILVVRTNTYYSAYYGGMFWRFALPHEYPYPLIVMTDGWMQWGWDHYIDPQQTTYNHRHIFVGGVYDVMGTITSKSSYWNCCAICNYGNNWAGRTSYTIVPTDIYHSYIEQHHYPPDQPLGLMPLYISYAGLAGQMDGVFAIPSADLEPEAEIIYSGDTYLCVPDVWRTDWRYWFAVKEE